MGRGRGEATLEREDAREAAGPGRLLRGREGRAGPVPGAGSRFGPLAPGRAPGALPWVS